jgi:hypothetical protein
VLEARSALFDRIGKILHEQFEDIAREPLPERWVDLINYLNDKERAQREPAGETIRPRPH